MSKKKTKNEDSTLEFVDSIDSESETLDVQDSVEPTKIETKVEKSKPVVVTDFLQAFRIYKKKNKKSELWDLDSVKAFACKRLGKTAGLPDWFKVFEKY